MHVTAFRLVGNHLLDNAGSRSTGETRLSSNLHLRSALGLGDLESLGFIHSEGSDYLRLGATLPLGPSGWRIGANASTMAYTLVQSDIAALGAKGWSDTFGLESNYPLIRSRLHNLYLVAQVDHKAYDNQAGGATLTSPLRDALVFAA